MLHFLVWVNDIFGSTYVYCGTKVQDITVGTQNLFPKMFLKIKNQFKLQLQMCTITISWKNKSRMKLFLILESFWQSNQ